MSVVYLGSLGQWYNLALYNSCISLYTSTLQVDLYLRYLDLLVHYVRCSPWSISSVAHLGAVGPHGLSCGLVELLPVQLRSSTVVLHLGYRSSDIQFRWSTNFLFHSKVVFGFKISSLNLVRSLLLDRGDVDHSIDYIHRQTLGSDNHSLDIQIIWSQFKYLVQMVSYC